MPSHMGNKVKYKKVDDIIGLHFQVKRGWFVGLFSL